MTNHQRVKVATACYIPNNNPVETEIFLKYLYHRLPFRDTYVFQGVGSDDAIGVNIDHYLFHEAPKHSNVRDRPVLGVSATTCENIFTKAIPFVIPQLPDFNTASRTSGDPRFRPTDMYAFVAFMDMLYALAIKGYDYMLLYETDCAFRNSNWVHSMIYEAFSPVGPSDKIYGTPVSWHPWANGLAASSKFMTYAHHVLTKTGVPMAIEGGHYGEGSCVYTNGALSLYPVKKVFQLFQRQMAELQYPRKTSSQDLVGMAMDYRKILAPFVAFDLHIGRALVQQFGFLGGMDQIVPLGSAYSGCAGHHLTAVDRLSLLYSGAKVAVHHLKPSEVPSGFYMDGPLLDNNMT